MVAVYALSMCARAELTLKATNYVHAVVCISPVFDDDTNGYSAKGRDASATAWFFNSNKFLVTAGHFVSDAGISTTNWTNVALMQEASNGWLVERNEVIPVRKFASVYVTVGESLAILELQRPFAGAQVLTVRNEPLTKDTPVMCLGYPDQNLCFAEGMFRGVLSEEFNECPPGSYSYELFNEKIRLIMSRGASGSPILDVHGHVVGVLNYMMIRDVMGMPTSTAWGYPNYTAIPIDGLKSSSVPVDIGVLSIKL